VEDRLQVGFDFFAEEFLGCPRDGAVFLGEVFRSEDVGRRA